MRNKILAISALVFASTSLYGLTVTSTSPNSPSSTSSNQNNWNQNQQRSWYQNQQRSWNQNQPNARTPQPKSYGESIADNDSKILAQIKQNLEDKNFDKSNSLQISVKSGRVFIAGKVNTPDDKKTLEQIAGSVPGVRAVTLNVRVVRFSGGQNRSSQWNSNSFQDSSGYQQSNDNNGSTSSNSDDSDLSYNDSSDASDDSSQAAANGAQVSDESLTQRIERELRGSWFSRGYPNVNVDVSEGNAKLTGTVDSPKDQRDLEIKVRNVAGVQSVDNQVQVKKPLNGSNGSVNGSNGSSRQTNGANGQNPAQNSNY